MAYNTGNPVEPNGSDDPRDLIDNAQIGDKLINSSDLTWLGRLGKVLKTWAGMTAEFIAAQAQRVVEFNEFLESSGYEVPVDYAAGLSITRPTQVVRFGGELYRAKDASLPFTTTTWAADAAKFFATGDSVLRQDLAQNGAAMNEYRDRTVKDKLDEHRSLNDFLAENGGVMTTAIAAAEASAYQYIDLAGGTYTAAVQGSTLTKKYYGGTLNVLNIIGNYYSFKNRAPVSDVQVAHPRSKCSVVDWTGANALWLGTSIPHQGIGVDSYPELFGKAMGVGVNNMAWSTSHAGYDVAGDPFSILTVVALSMTEDDRQAGLAAYGSSSAYSDTFHPITKASQQTADYRIRQAFSSSAFGYGVVVLDHAHNDMTRPLGTKTPETQTATGVTIGATTVITLAAIGSIVVGDALTFRVDGIPKLNYLSGRVQAVAGNNVTLSYNSTGHAGAFISGHVVKLDRTTIWGAWSFLTSYILHSAFIHQGVYPFILMAGAPSEFTNNEPTPAIYGVNEKIRDYAESIGYSFFDIAHYMDVKAFDQIRYFPDGVHATTTATRQVLANHWVQWASGGALKPFNENLVLKRAGTAPYLKDHEPIYDEYQDGFATPALVEGKQTLLLSDDFSSGSLAAYVVTGAATIVTAPWGVGNAMRAVVANGAGSFSKIQKTLAFNTAIDVSFDFYMPNLAGATTGVIGLFDLVNGSGQNYSRVQLVIGASGAFLQIVYFKAPAANIVNIETSIPVTMGVKHSIRMKVRKTVSGLASGLLLYLDGLLANRRQALDNIGQTNPTQIVLGGLGNTSGVSQTLYFGSVVVNTAPILDTSARASGTFTSNDGKTVTVVNGIITAIV